MKTRRAPRARPRRRARSPDQSLTPISVNKEPRRRLGAPRLNSWAISPALRRCILHLKLRRAGIQTERKSAYDDVVVRTHRDVLHRCMNIANEALHRRSFENGRRAGFRRQRIHDPQRAFGSVRAGCPEHRARFDQPLSFFRHGGHQFGHGLDQKCARSLMENRDPPEVALHDFPRRAAAWSFPDASFVWQARQMHSSHRVRSRAERQQRSTRTRK